MVERGGRPRLSVEDRQREAQRRNRWAREAKQKAALQQPIDVSLASPTIQIPPQVEATHSSQSETQPAPAKRKGGRPRLSEEERQRRRPRYVAENPTKTPTYSLYIFPDQGGVEKPARVSDQYLEYMDRADAAGVLEHLNPRMKLIIDLTRQNPSITLQELAAQLNVTSRQRAHQLENRALGFVWRYSPIELKQQYEEYDLSQRNPSQEHLLLPETQLKIREAKRKNRERKKQQLAKHAIVFNWS
jgi:hypothetical protein